MMAGNKAAIQAEANPRIPARPVLSLAAFGREAGPCDSVLDAGEAKLGLNARTALAQALKHAGIGDGDSVLLPAYHCPAMVSPLVWLGVEPLFYPLRPDTTVDVEELARCLRPNCRAVVAVHYFGFIQDLGPLRRFCDERGLVLIEDCAHAFFGSFEGRPVGCQGDYAIASLMKFLPIHEGGCLASARRSLADIEMRSGGLFFQLKSALNTLEMACEYGRLPWLNPLLRAKDWLWGKFKGGAGQAASTPLAGAALENHLDASFEFDPAGFGLGIAWACRAIAKGMSFSRACALRRGNYLALLKAFGGIHGGHPLYPGLPEGVYPQVFPLVVDAPEAVFPILKQRGVPIIRFGEFRWEGVDASVCPVSAELSRKVFQFPCHQSLSAEEIDWLAATVTAVLSETQTDCPTNHALELEQHREP